jgi:GT2 family glycosyltransferase
MVEGAGRPSASSAHDQGDTALLVLSCDPYADVWPVFFTLFFRYWPDCPFPVYLGANHLSYADDRVTTLRIGDDASWAQSTRLMLEALDTPYVLVFLEDYLLTAPVDGALVRVLMREMRSIDAEFIRFRPSEKPDPAVAGHPLLAELMPGTPYRVSLDIGLWRRETLISLLRGGETAWDMEIDGSRRSDATPGFYCTTVNVFSRTNGLERGQWLRYNLPLLRKEHIELPPGRPVMPVWESWFLGFGKRVFWRVWSTRAARATLGPAWRAVRHRRRSPGGDAVDGGSETGRQDRMTGVPAADRPTVSIVMATHDRAATLRRAIDSVRRQTFTDWELIVVDDGSTDATQELLGELVDERIRVFRHAENRGVCAAKNTGLDHIRGAWFTTMDSDDEIVVDALQAMLDCAERTGATAVTCNCLDSVTGEFTGAGCDGDGRLSPRETARCRGEFWGLTRTTLLGDLRYDERLPGYEETMWLLINRKARRYYIHRALRIYHTEGADRVTKASRAADLGRKAAVYVALGEHRDYLRELKAVDRPAFRRMWARIWVARCLLPFVGRHRGRS